MKGNPKKNRNSGTRTSALLYRISKAMAGVKDGRELLKIIIAETQLIFGFYDIGLSVIDKSGLYFVDWAVLYKEISPSEANFAMAGGDFEKFSVDEPLFKYIFARAEALEKPFIENMTAEFVENFKDFPHLPVEIEYGYKQFLVTTLKFGGKTFGILNFNSTRENHFDDCDFELFQAIADLVAVAVANILANEEIIEREREKSVLLSISQAIATVRSKEDLLQFIIEKIKPTLNFYDCGIFVFDREKETLEDLTVSFPNISPSEASYQLAQNNAAIFKYKGSVWGQVFEMMRTAGEPIIVNYKNNEISGWNEYVQTSVIEQTGYEDCLVTILTIGGEEIGAFVINSLEKEMFSEDQFGFFQNIANQMAVAVANILANEEILEREKEKSVLLSISQAIAAIHNTEQLFKVIFERIQPLFGFYDVGLFILSNDGKHITDWAANRPEISPSFGNRQIKQLQMETLLLDGSPLQYVINQLSKSDTARIFSYDKSYFDTIADPIFKENLKKIVKKGGYREFLATILKTGGKMLGLLFFNAKTSGFFDSEQFGLFQAVADQIAVAVANILANEEIVERTREKSVLLSISSDIASARNAVELLQIIREKAQQLIPFYDTGILIVEDDGEHHYDLAVNLAGWDDSKANQKLQALNMNRIVHPGSYLEFAMRLIETASSPVIEDYEQRFDEFDHPFFEIMKESGYREAIIGALKSGGKTFGTLWLNSLEKNYFKPEQFEIFQALTDQVAVALANILANEEILKRTLEKSVQLAVSNALTTIRDSEKLIVEIAGEINKIIPNDAFSIHIKQNNPFLNLEFNDVRAIKENGVFVPLRRRAFWKSKGLSEDKLDVLIRESEPILLEKAVYADEKYIALCQKLKLLKLISDEFGFRSVIYAPVSLQNGNLITLTASSKRANAFTAEHLEKLCETGNQIALALESNLAFAEVSALKKQLEAENTYLAEEVKTAYNFAEIIGSAPALQKVFRQIELVAPTDTTILLEGETGTGKELFARAVHDLSPRKSRPLIKINCASLPANLIESELFGHERGAFTGANERRIGKFELAHNGTIFLDEIGELPLELQAKLLRVLQEGEVERIGGKTPLKINLRIVAATNRNLRREVAEQRFRQDLYFRLNTVVLVLPSLGERREDIPALALYFAEKYGNRLGRKIRGISNKMLEALMNYEFPGNVRELEHIIEESVIFSKGETLQLHRPLKFAPDSSTASPFADNSSSKSLAEIEREHILATLKQTGGRIRGESGAAEILQIKPTTLEARMKKLGIKKLHTNISPEIK